VRLNDLDRLTVLEECYLSMDAVTPRTLLGSYAAFARKLGTERYVALVSAQL